MMKIKNIFGGLALAAFTLTAVSCSEDTMDRINKDNAHPGESTVSAKFQLTDAIVSSVFTTNCGQLAWYVSIYTEQTFGTGNNQAKNVELRNINEICASSTFDNEWNGTYLNLNNIKQMIEKCSEGGLNEGQSDIKGMAEVLAAYNWGALTDLFGDIPYSEALTEGISAPKVDSQEEIYKGILTYLDDAIADLTAAGSTNNAGSQDLLYAGNPKKWLALAHAMKARYLLHELGRATDKNAQLESIISEAEAALEGGFEGAELSIFTGYSSGSTNPWSAYWLSRDYIGSTTTVDNLMLDRNYPFEDLYNFDMYEEDTLAIPGDAGLAGETETCNAPYWLYQGYKNTVPAHLLSLSEVYFTIAEAKARLGQDAILEFTEGISASLADVAVSCGTTISLDDINEYIDGVTSQKFEENPLSEILVQKYLAQTRDEQLETYNDMRRCKYMDGSYPVAMVNPKNTSGSANRWPLRLPYGSSDVLSNPNVNAAFGTGNDAGMYIFTDNVWWAGGSR